jgi:hypothetical protein
VGVKRSQVAQVAHGVKQGRLLLKHLVPAVWKPMHSLWNEVIGFLFISLAILCGFGTYRNYHRHPEALYVAFVAVPVLLWFGIDAFRKARKISRS